MGQDPDDGVLINVLLMTVDIACRNGIKCAMVLPLESLCFSVQRYPPVGSSSELLVCDLSH